MKLLRHPLGLASMASLPLLLFATAFVLLAGVLLFAFRDINAMLEQAAEQKIPVLTQTTALVRECEWLRGMMFRLMQTDSELVREAIIITLKERIDDAGEMASRLEAIGLYKDKVESLKEQLSSLDGIADDVNTLITRWIILREQRQNQVKSLRSLSEELIALDVSGVEQLEAWKQGAYRILSLLLVLSTDLDVPYGLRVTSEMYEWVRNVRADLSRVPSTPHISGMVEAANHLYDKLILCAQGENGIIPSFKRQHAVSQQFAALTIRMDALSESIMIVAGQLMAQAKTDAEHARDGFSERVSGLSGLLYGFVVLVLAVIAATYLYLARHVIRPVIRLNNCMRLRTQGFSANIPYDGAWEIREMARSVFYFVSEIEHREHELRESHAGLEEQVATRTAELKRLSNRLLQAQEEERFKLAAELHDDIGATMGVIKFGIERALLMLDRPDAIKVQEPLNEAVDLVKGLARQLRRIQNELRPAHIDVGLLTSLEWFCKDYQGAYSHLRLDLAADVDENDIPMTLRIVLFRVIQESLNNIAKHSGATSVKIRLQKQGNTLKVSVTDNGVGFDITAAMGMQETGRGLKSMRERVELSGGTFIIRSKPNKGTQLTACWEN